MSYNYVICFSISIHHTQSNKFYKLGILIGMSFAQQGSGFPFFSPTCFKYLSNQDIANYEIDLQDVHQQTREFLEKVYNVCLGVCMCVHT